jgi:hypothetical protein
MTHFVNKANSGKNKIVSSRPNERLDFGSGTKETVMTEGKVIAARNLEDRTQVYHSHE